MLHAGDGWGITPPSPAWPDVHVVVTGAEHAKRCAPQGSGTRSSHFWVLYTSHPHHLYAQKSHAWLGFKSATCSVSRRMICEVAWGKGSKSLALSALVLCQPPSEPVWSLCHPSTVDLESDRKKGLSSALGWELISSLSSVFSSVKWSHEPTSRYCGKRYGNKQGAGHSTCSNAAFNVPSNGTFGGGGRRYRWADPAAGMKGGREVQASTGPATWKGGGAGPADPGPRWTCADKSMPDYLGKSPL